MQARGQSWIMPHLYVGRLSSVFAPYLVNASTRSVRVRVRVRVSDSVCGVMQKPRRLRGVTVRVTVCFDWLSVWLIRLQSYRRVSLTGFTYRSKPETLTNRTEHRHVAGTWRQIFC